MIDFKVPKIFIYQTKISRYLINHIVAIGTHDAFHGCPNAYCNYTI